MANADSINAIQRTVDAEAIVVGPDHPFTVGVPDILIGNQGTLTGVFFPTELETKNIDRLLVRLTLSKLALPINLTSVLILRDELPQTIYHPQVQKSFDAAISVRDLRELRTIVHDAKSKRKKRSHLSELKNEKFFRTDAFLTESRSLFEKGEKEFRATAGLAEQLGSFHKVKVNSWVNGMKQWRLASNVYSVGSYFVAMGLPSAGYLSKKHLIGLSHLSTLHDYSLDNGIQYFRSQARFKFLNVERLSSLKRDPLQMMRWAAFSGWILINTDDLNYIDSLYAQLRMKYHGRI
jgi:hypothetical protein